MDPEIQRLVDITAKLQLDLVDQKYTECAKGLQDREEIIQNLCRRYDSLKNTPLPEDLSEVLKRVRELDSRMEDFLIRELQETGQELARAADMKKNTSASPKLSRCFDRQA